MKPSFILLAITFMVVFAAVSLHAQTCDYTPGDINGNGQVNGLDIVFAVSYLKGGARPSVDCRPACSGVPDPFYAAMDVNGNCATNGIDITFFVAYLKGLQPILKWCPDCPPIARQ